MAKKEEVTFRRGPSKTLPSQSVSGTLLIANDTGNVYVDDSNSKRIQLTDTRLIKRTGDTVTGDLIFSEGATVKLPLPQCDSDGANKQYVDDASKVSGAASTVKDSNLAVNRALVSDSAGKITASGTTSTEVGYLSGVVSNVQKQLDGKCPNTDATATSAGRMSAVDKKKLDTVEENANYIKVDSSLDGSSTNPVQNAVIAAALSNTAKATPATETTAGLMTGDDKAQLRIAYQHSQEAHAPSDAQPNQNAFSTVKVGTTSVAAGTETDTLILTAGSHITLSVDTGSKTVTISGELAEDTTYTSGAGIRISGTTIINSGVHSVSTSSKAGYISVNTDGTTRDVPVAGLGSAAFCTKQELINANAPNAEELQGVVSTSSGGTGADLSASSGQYVKTNGADAMSTMTAAEVLDDIGAFPAAKIKIHPSTTDLPDVEDGVILITYDP